MFIIIQIVIYFIYLVFWTSELYFIDWLFIWLNLIIKMFFQITSNLYSMVL